MPRVSAAFSSIGTECGKRFEAGCSLRRTQHGGELVPQSAEIDEALLTQLEPAKG